jgi:hypothetical protein
MTDWNADAMYYNPHQDASLDAESFEKDQAEIEADIAYEQSIDFEERSMILDEAVDVDDLIEPDDFRADSFDDFEGYRDEVGA